MSLSLPRPPAWVADAKCARSNAEDWFQMSTSGKTAAYLCGGCPALSECLAYALSFGPQLEGVWGGTTAERRRTILKAGQS